MASRILLVENHPVVRQTLRRLLEQEGFEVVGEAPDADEAFRRAADLCPDVVVIDLARPVARCLSVAREMVRTMPLRGVIFMAFEEYLVAHVFQAGVRGYVLKARIAEDLPTAIQEVASGHTFVSPGILSDDLAVGPEESSNLHV